jgi:hypothetical protein
MQQIYLHVDPLEMLEQKINAQTICEIDGRKYKVVFQLDTFYASQSRVVTLLFTGDNGWQTVLVQDGIENELVKHYHSLTPPARAALRTKGLKLDIIAELEKLCRLAAVINS